MENHTWITMSDGHEVYLKYWYEEKVKPKAVLQLSHGMAEHIQRYQGLAEYLVSKGIFVFGNDHRGHGMTGQKAGLLGFFAEENGFERVVEDLKEINDFIHQQYPETPIILMGHSMGSFLVRRFIQRYQGVVDGVIISGTGGNLGLLGKIGKQIAKSQIRKIGKRTESPLMNKLSFGSYNKKFQNAETGYEWLSRDRQEVQKYIEDPLCGYVCTAGFYYDLLTGIEVIHKNEEVTKIEKNLPFFFISGASDPVGNDSKGVMNVISQYQKSGIRNIEYKLYEDGRHEMLNEVNRDEVMVDILNWIEKQLQSVGI